MRLFALLSITAAALGGHYTHTRTAPAAPPPVAADPSDCAGGQAEIVEVRIKPTAIENRGRGQTLALAIDVAQQLDDRAAVIGAVEVIDDRGNRVAPRHDLARLDARRDTPASYRFTTPPGLADGYYNILVSVLARGDSRAEELATRELHVRVDGGTITPITSEEWLTRSESGLVSSSPTVQP